MVGKFITFEGGEGAGKSTQIRLLADRLAGEGRAVVVTREPGGTPAAEEIRRALLAGAAEPLGRDGEAMLFAAARADHVERVIRPALGAGKWVLCDRFSDSTRVYQGASGGVDPAMLRALDRAVVGDTQPNLTIVLDLPAEIGLARAASRRQGVGEAADRFERDDLALHEARREAFRAIARAEPDRCVLIDATQSREEVAAAVWRAVRDRLMAEAA